MTFFGLSSEYRIGLFTQIHEIVFHGKGGYNWQQVYDMPIWIRRFTFNKINEFYKKEKEIAEGEAGVINADTAEKVMRKAPKISPNSTYKTKAPSK